MDVGFFQFAPQHLQSSDHEIVAIFVAVNFEMFCLVVKLGDDIVHQLGPDFLKTVWTRIRICITFTKQ